MASDDGPGRASPTVPARKAIRVLVADDSAAIRDAMVALLTSDPDLGVLPPVGVATAELQLAADTEPDVAVLDVRMPGAGVDFIRRLRRLHPELALVCLTAELTDRDALLAAGAHQFVLKGANDDLLAAIHTSHRLNHAGRA